LSIKDFQLLIVGAFVVTLHGMIDTPACKYLNAVGSNDILHSFV